jgi:hypothetical protein
VLLIGIGMVLLFSFCPAATAQQVIEIQDPVSTKTVTVANEHSATKALLLSLLPGGGQVYNGQAWKIPIIYGALAGVGYYAYYNYDRMVMFKDEYLYRVNNNDATNLADYASYPRSSIYNLYNSYNRNFQLMVIIAAGIYALNLIDAYVFGHLYDFQIDDNLTLALTPGLQPTIVGIQPTVGFSLSF